MWWCVQQTEWLVLVARAYFKDPKIIVGKKKIYIYKKQEIGLLHNIAAEGRRAG